MTLFIALLCVTGIAAGQVLFKLCAKAYQAHGLSSSQTLPLFLAAITLYGVTTLAWIWVLSRAELGKVYPLMALAFVLVPLASHFLFAEQFSLVYVAGILLIVIGIVLTAFH